MICTENWGRAAQDAKTEEINRRDAENAEFRRDETSDKSDPSDKSDLSDRLLLNRIPMKPEIFTTCSTMNRFSLDARANRQTIGFVPTMGALHAGHESLIEAARRENNIVIVSIFVNPTQFGPGEDFKKYPRTFDTDVEICRSHDVDAIFAPKPSEMYPEGYATYIDQEALTQTLCGASRPGHFRGVLTVCCKLFNITASHTAYFGQKDYQQALVIRRMVRDLNLPLKIETCPTVREHDGLALSSRNRYLSESERADAVVLYKALVAAREMFEQGETEAGKVKDAMSYLINQASSAKIDYAAIVDPETLQPLDKIDGPALAALAVKIGNTRLIDNMIISRR